MFVVQYVRKTKKCPMEILDDSLRFRPFFLLNIHTSYSSHFNQYSNFVSENKAYATVTTNVSQAEFFFQMNNLQALSFAGHKVISFKHAAGKKIVCFTKTLAQIPMAISRTGQFFGNFLQIPTPFSCGIFIRRRRRQRSMLIGR